MIQSLNFTPPLSLLHPIDIIALSSLDVNLMNDTIIINVYTPMLAKSKFNLKQIIPIPIIRDNNNFILNMDTRYLMEFDGIHAEIPSYELTQCAHTTNLIVCLTTTFSRIIPLEAILNNKSTKAICIYEKLPYKSQLIKVSDESIYVHITNSILLKILCGRQMKIMNITHSQEIQHDKKCRIRKQKNTNKNLYVTTVKIGSGYIDPKFEVYDNRFWTRKQIRAKEFKTDINNLINNFNTLSRDYNQRKQPLEISDLNPFTHLNKFFNDLINYLVIFTIIVVVLLILILIMCCICRK